MLANRRIACIIPARLRSSRFPKKILASLGGKPLLQHAYEAAKRVPFFDVVAFAIDAEETAERIAEFGGSYYFTAAEHSCGTQRLVQLHQEKKIEADIWVNWQADEPFLTESALRDLLATCDAEGADLWTLKKRIFTSQEVESPDIVKVVTDERGNALYFSRSPIPYYRDQRTLSEKIYFKHIGLYAYTSDALKKIATMQPTYLEQAEQLEQLQFLAQGLTIKVHETEHESLGIDLPRHLELAEEHLRALLG